MGRGLRLEDASRAKKMDFEQTCVVYLIVRPSAGRGLRPSGGRGLRLEDVSRGKKMDFEQTCVVYLIVRPSVGRGEDSKMYLEARRCMLSKLVLFT